jgi:hypothetical protein
VKNPVLCNWLSRAIISGKDVNLQESPWYAFHFIPFVDRNGVLLAQNIANKCFLKYLVVAPYILVSSISASDLKDFVVYTG